MGCRSVSWCVLLALLTVLPGAGRAVGGISGAKLSTPNTSTVPTGSLEFEPYFGVVYSTQQFNNHAQIEGTGLRNRSYETGFRFTAGFTRTLEVGLVLPILFQRSENRATDQELRAAGLGDLPLGIKWRFFDRKIICLAVAVGVTLPTGDLARSDAELSLGEGVYRPEVGFIASVAVYKGLTLDLQLGYGVGLRRSGGAVSMQGTFDVALGYAIGRFQPVLELTQTVSGWDGALQYDLALLGGLTWELSAKVIVVTGVRVPVVGKNSPRELGYSLAFTIVL